MMKVQIQEIVDFRRDNES